MDLRSFVIDPHAFRRRLVCEAIAATEAFSLLGAAASLSELKPTGPDEIDVVLVNASVLSEEPDGLHKTAARYPNASILLYDSRSELAPLLDSIELPVAGFLTFNHLSHEEFSRALTVIAHGGAVIEPYTAQLLLEYLRDLHLPATAGDWEPGQLTDREHDVLGLVRQGLSNKEIAGRLAISLGTVRAHLRSIFRKLDVPSRAGAASYFQPRSAGRRIAG